jgi:4-amino-4-deoxy-L-arabinose transferase-like glycosyltransferase
MRSSRSLILLGLFAFALFWPGERAIPAIDRDEARFAEASRQMAESHDYVDIRFQDEARYKKPVGIYWLQTAAVDLLGEDASNPIWPYRLPSLLGAIGAVLAAFLLARSMADQATALLASGLLACSLLLNLEARLATVDAVLTACITLMLAGLYRIRDRHHAGVPTRKIDIALFWGGMAAGILLKGPVAPALAALACITLFVADRRQTGWLKATRPLAGMAILAIVVAPWLILIGLRSHGLFFEESLGHDLGAKLAAPQESHGGFPGLYALEFPLAFWPGSLAAMLAIPWVWNHRREANVTFLLAWIVPGWLMFEAMPTKLPHYVLPLYPAIAVLAALGLRSPYSLECHPGQAQREPGFAGKKIPDHASSWLSVMTRNRGTIIIASSFYALATIALIVPFGMAAFFRQCDPAIPCFRIPMAVAGISGVTVAALYSFRQRWRIAVFGCLAAYTALFGFMLPAQNSFFVSRMMAEHRQAYGASVRQGMVAVSGFHEPSVVLWFGPATALTDGAGAADNLASGKAVLAYVAGPDLTAFRDQAALLGIDMVRIDQIHGFNIARGQPIDIAVFRKGS